MDTRLTVRVSPIDRAIGETMPGYLTIASTQRCGAVAQLGEHLLCMYPALSAVLP